MGVSSESSEQTDDQIYTPSTGGGVFSARHPGYDDKSLRRRSTVKDGDVETASVNEKDDCVDERYFHKKQVFTGWQLAWQVHPFVNKAAYVFSRKKLIELQKGSPINPSESYTVTSAQALFTSSRPPSATNPVRKMYSVRRPSSSGP